MSGGMSSGGLGGGASWMGPNGGTSVLGTLGSGACLTKPDADLLYVELAGDVMSGALVLPSATVAGKPLAVSPDAANSLEWRPNGLYSTGGGGGGVTSVNGQTGAVNLDPTYVNVTGDTMTGTIASQGDAVDSGGALRVTSPNTTVTDKRLYTTAYAPADVLGGGVEYGAAFTPASALYLVAVRWYRSTTNPGITPTAARLWDTTATATAVWTSSGTPPGWENTTAGWKEYRLPAGTQPLLVAGRQYVLSYTAPAGNNFFAATAYTPVPDSGLTYGGNRSGTSGTYPSGNPGAVIGMDGAFRTVVSAPTPAASGAIRLPNDLAGRIAWRNGADGADLALTVDPADALTFAGSPVQTRTTADARYLQLSGGTLTGAVVEQGASATANVQQSKVAADTQPRFRLDTSGLHEWGPGGATAPDTTLYRAGANALRTDGNLGVGVAPAAWGSGWRVVQAGQTGAFLAATGSDSVEVTSNSYNDGTNTRAIVTGLAAVYAQGSGVHFWYTAPSVTAGSVQTFTERLRLDAAGNLGLGGTPSAWGTGYRALQIGQAGVLDALTGSPDTELRNNSYTDAGPTSRAIVTGASSLLQLTSTGTFVIQTAPSVAAGATQAFATRLTIAADGKLSYGQAAGYFGLTVGPAGAASALPAAPAGYWTVNLNGTDFKLPYYNP